MKEITRAARHTVQMYAHISEVTLKCDIGHAGRKPPCMDKLNALWMCVNHKVAKPNQCKEHYVALVRCLQERT